MFRIFLQILVGTFCFSAFAKNSWQSGSAKIPLLELYSSEGCSSCPPAEKWMADLMNNKDLFVKFTPINFHVDYWNQLGWVDRFSKSQFTDRQRQYSTLWGTGRIYTPAFVLNGKDSGPSGSLSFLNSAQIEEPGNLSVKKLNATDLEIHFQAKAKEDYDVYVAEFANGLQSDVSKGENEGKTLKHNFVVLRFSVNKLHGNKAVVHLPATKTEGPNVDGFAAWITRSGDLVPIQSVGGLW